MYLIKNQRSRWFLLLYTVVRKKEISTKKLDAFNQFVEINIILYILCASMYVCNVYVSSLRFFFRLLLLLYIVNFFGIFSSFDLKSISKQSNK